MASLCGDSEAEGRYAARAKISAAAYEAKCWKEEFGYYVADVTIKDCKYSYGPGCFVDQLCAAGLSSAVGLGHLWNAQHEHRARVAICKNNIVTKPPFAIAKVALKKFSASA